jgi:lipopolysaccharide transport system ATP-binding protein
MSDTVIRVENLSKKYIIGHQKQERYTALRDVIAEGAKSVGRKLLKPGKRLSDPGGEEFWALKEVSFEIKQGDRVGIIGRNGAGKSTLLKILSRITEPTSGRISIKGRVASLLEVGTGFHPELTGRENIYLNGAILGMSKAEIKKKFEEIVAFAEVEKFLDTPVKRYSSGMYVRLAFAVAAHLEPEILVVDEVLAVGDAQFQNKCLGKMGEVAREGRTVLFVSHNLSAVQALCQTGIYLDSGKINTIGNISTTLAAYQQTVFDNSTGKNEKIEVAQGQVKFTKWQLAGSLTKQEHSCYSREECNFVLTLVTRRQITGVNIGFAIWNSDEKLIIAASSLDGGKTYLSLEEGVYEFIFKVRLPLKSDTYHLDVSVNTDEGQLDRWQPATKLLVLPNSSTNLPEIWQGLLNEEVDFEVHSVANPIFEGS